jgi:hypothetical protein
LRFRAYEYYKMSKILIYLFLPLLSVLLILSACSTEKNTLLSRSFHGLTAKYNGHWNAQELLKVSFKTFNDGYEDNFYELLPMEILPNATEVKGLFPAIDTAISKCTKVIANHSMPTASKPWAKDVENNTWIDENWITIGESQYMRRDYDAALKSFEYISKFWKNDQSIYLAEVWKARTQLQLGNETEAIFSIALVEKFINEAEEEKSEDKKGSKSKSSKKAKKSKSAKNQKKETPPKPTKALKFGLYKAKTQLAIVQNDDKAAAENLELALKNCNNKREKGRLYYVLGQLYERQQQNDKAQECYKKVAKYPASYQIQFHARINRAIGGGEKVRKDLKKMLRDEKNLEFRDQIHYALAQLDMRENKEQQAIENYTLSASTSITNARQKGISYEALGDLSMKNRSYVSAQKYYDSCVQVLPKEFPRYDAISKKAEKLKELVVQVTIIEKEDSLQMIAGMSADDREKFVENEIKRIKTAEKARKEKDAKRMQAIQDAQAATAAQAGGKGYWNNPKTKTEGIAEFKKLWGSRENEDNWRLSQKISNAISASEIDTLLNNAVVNSAENDSLNVESLLANVPVGDSAYAESNKKLIAALYTAGVIYTEQLQEDARAFTYLDRAVKMKYEDKHKLLSSYKIYSMYRLSDDTKANENKNFILDKYPSSDYAGYLRDPNYFVKKKKIEALAEDDYVNTLERYNRKVYSIVLSKADEVITDQKENPYRSKYMLLKALAIGQTNDDKLLMVPVLNLVVTEYPETPEAKRANELLEIIKNGVSVNKPVDFSKPEIYSKKASDIYFVCVFLPETENSNAAKIKISDFNRDQYSAKGYKINSRIFNKQSMITIETFEKLELAKEYIDNFKSTKKNLGEIAKHKILLISKDNLIVLFGTMNLEEYESFLDDKY